MHVFVYEALSAGAIADSSPKGSLRAEGEAMLSAVMEDFNQIPGVRTLMLARSASEGSSSPSRRLKLKNCEVTETTAENEPNAFRRLAKQADFCLVIAPECDGFLYERCRWVEEIGSRLLGPGSQAIQLTSDKRRLAEYLAERQISTPRCYLAEGNSGCPFPAVLKPRDGAGSQATFLVKTKEDLQKAIGSARNEGWTGELLLQPFVVGKPSSVAFLAGQNRVDPLLPASQEISDDGRFQYQGGVIPLLPRLALRATRLGCQAVQAIPVVRGYVGVDLILGQDENGADDQLIEINPRLTTSYVGLRALARTNLAEAMLRMAQGERVEPLLWHGGSIRFLSNGNISWQIE